MSPARVVHLSTVHRAHDNRIYNKMVPALLDAGFDTTLVVCSDADETDPVPLVALPQPSSRLRRLVVTQAHAWRALSRLRPTLVHFHDPELVPLVWAWSRAHRALCVFDAHEDLVAQMESKEYLHPAVRPLATAYARVLTRWADAGMDAVVAATDTIAAGFRNPRTTVVRNYPWRKDFTVAPRPVAGRLVYVGDLSEERKLSFMMDVAEAVRARIPHAHLVLAGRVREDAAGAMARCDGEAIAYLGLLKPTEVPDVLASAQIGLLFFEPLKNNMEGSPNKLFEYMAAGVPFAASDFPAWRASVGAYDANVFVDSEDVAATAAAIADLLSDPERMRAMGERGQAAIAERFSFDGEVPALVGLVESLGQSRTRK